MCFGHDKIFSRFHFVGERWNIVLFFTIQRCAFDFQWHLKPGEFRGRHFLAREKIAFIHELYDPTEHDRVFLLKVDLALAAFNKSIFSKSCFKIWYLNKFLPMNVELDWIMIFWTNGEFDDWRFVRT